MKTVVSAVKKEAREKRRVKKGACRHDRGTAWWRTGLYIRYSGVYNQSSPALMSRPLTTSWTTPIPRISRALRPVMASMGNNQNG